MIMGELIITNKKIKQVELINFDTSGHANTLFNISSNPYVLHNNKLIKLHYVKNVVYCKELAGIDNVEIVYNRVKHNDEFVF